VNWLRRNFDSCYIVAQVWLDGLVILASCFVGHHLYVRYFDIDQSLGLYSRLFVVITGLTLGSFWVGGLYRWRKSILNVEEYRGIFRAVVLSFLGSSTAIFILREVAVEEKPWVPTHIVYRLMEPIHQLLELDEVERYSRVMFLIIFLLIFMVIVIERAVSFSFLGWLHRKGFGSHNVAVYGTGPMAIGLERKLRLFPTLGYRFVGFMSDDPAWNGRNFHGFPVVGGKDDLLLIQKHWNIHRVFIADPEMPEDKLLDLCSLLEKEKMEYQVVPRLFHFFTRRFFIDNLDSVPLITPVNSPAKPIYHFLKRVFDIIVSALLLLLFSPLLLILSVWVKRESAGPVLFAQTRIGFHGKPFRMVKFRTMFQDQCDDQESPVSKDDPRVTRVGKFLRSSSLDELPQLWNVLLGDMSLVGPRPEMPFIVDAYSAVNRLRLDAKPGITGLWQVSAARNAPIHENVDYDLYYIENQSFFLDAVICVLTVFAVLRVRSTH